MTQPPVITANIETADEFVPLTPAAGGWTPVAGDARAQLHTLCETEEVWSGVAVLQPCTFEYAAHQLGAILLLEGSATLTSEDRSWDVGAGDVVYLRPGATTTWVVHAPLREFFVAFAQPDQS